MKKRFLILSFLILFLVVGCGKPKTELDKFKHYLKKNEDYKCSKNICIETVSIGNLITYTDEINFDTKTITHSSDGNNALVTSKTIYNWATDTATYYSYTLGVEIDATYNYTTDEFNCDSSYEDKEYVETECDIAKLSFKDLKTGFEELIKNSETLYFDEM